LCSSISDYGCIIDGNFNIDLDVTNNVARAVNNMIRAMWQVVSSS